MRELKEELLNGDRPAPEIREAVDTLNSLIAQAQRDAAQYGVKDRVMEIDAEQISQDWGIYSPARKQSLFRSVMEKILIHPAVPPKNVFNPSRVEVVWR
ncbi:hypothetical protein ACWCO9_30350 [Streptomyces sp. NPDC001937]